MNTLCNATCGNVVYMRCNAAFTLHLGHVTGDMNSVKLKVMRSLCIYARVLCARIMRAYYAYVLCVRITVIYMRASVLCILRNVTCIFVGHTPDIMI